MASLLVVSLTRARRWLPAVTSILSAILVEPACAHVAEIQIYDGEIAPPGIFNLTVHSNYTPAGQSAAHHPEGFSSDDAFTIGPEFAYGVTEWLEVGALLPVVTGAHGHWQFDGTEFRALLTVPHAAERTFFYAVNFAFVYSDPQWHPERYSAEIRPILGLHLNKFEMILNPIVETSFQGFKRTTIEPAARIVYSMAPKWQAGVEFYSDVGSFGRLNRARDRSEQLFAVVDYSGEAAKVQAGIGFGLTAGSDDLVLKLIISRNLN